MAAINRNVAVAIVAAQNVLILVPFFDQETLESRSGAWRIWIVMIKFLAVCRFSALPHMITMSGYPEKTWRVWVQVGDGPASWPDSRPAWLPVLWDLVTEGRTAIDHERNPNSEFPH